MNQVNELLNIDPVVNIFSSFTVGIVLSPLSNGLLYLFIGYIITEILVYNMCKNYKPGLRLIYLLFGILGFFIGRAIIGDDDPVRMYYGQDQNQNKKFLKP